MAIAVANQDSDGAIHPGVPLDVWLSQRKQLDPSGIDTPNAEYNYMKPKWDRIQAVLDGTDAMRSAGVAYLPQHEYESNPAYHERKAASVLDNWTSRTVEVLV